MKNKKIKIIFALFIFLVLIINFLGMLKADYIDEVLEEVDDKNWKEIVKHYIENPRPQNDNPQVMNRLWEKEYVKNNDKLILDTWNYLDTKSSSEKNYRYELWKTLNDDNRKRLLKAFSSEKDSEGKNLKILWSLSDNKQSFERQSQKNKILSLLDRNQRISLMKEVTKKEIDIPEDPENKLKISYNEYENGDQIFIISDPENKNKEHIIPITNLPSEFKKIEFAKSDDNHQYYTFYVFDNEGKKRVLSDAGIYLQGETPIGYDEKEKIVVHGYKNTKYNPVINFGGSKDSVFKVSKNKIELWDKSADITGKSANVQIGSEAIFAHPDGPSNKDWKYVSLEEKSEDVLSIRGSGRTLRNDGLGFYFKDEGILDLSGKYKNEGNKPILRFYKEGNKPIVSISAQTSSTGPISFTLGKDANIIIGENSVNIEAKDSGGKYYQYAAIGNNPYINTPIDDYQKYHPQQYVSRLIPVKMITPDGERVGDGSQTNRLPNVIKGKTTRDTAPGTIKAAEHKEEIKVSTGKTELTANPESEIYGKAIRKIIGEKKNILVEYNRAGYEKLPLINGGVGSSDYAYRVGGAELAVRRTNTGGVIYKWSGSRWEEYGKIENGKVYERCTTCPQLEWIELGS